MKLPKEIIYEETGPEWDVFEQIVRKCAAIAAGSRQATIETSFAISHRILEAFDLPERK